LKANDAIGTGNHVWLARLSHSIGVKVNEHIDPRQARLAGLLDGVPLISLHAEPLMDPLPT